MPNLVGQTIDFTGAEGYISELKKKKVIVHTDIRNEPRMGPLLQQATMKAGTLGRVDVPFEDEGGRVGILALSSPEPRSWDSLTVQVFQEVGEMVHLMFRDARVRDRLHESEAIFRLFAENIRFVFWMTDAEKREMVYVSPAYEEIWGLSVESLKQKPDSFLDAIHPEDRERVRAAIALQVETTYDQTYRVVRPDGNIRLVRDRGYPIADENGKTYRILGFAEDITALHETQRRLESTQAQMISKAKFAALGEMASGIAHEINNPLAVIHGLSLQLHEMRLAGKVEKALVLDSLKTIEKMANRIANITKGLRTFSRQTEHDPMVPADVRAIAKETLVMCEAKFQNLHAGIRFRAPTQPVVVKCRSSEISQVILNLLNNALDAVSAAEMRTISLHIEKKGHIIQLAVEDSGGGVPEEIQDRIFQPFFTTKEVGKGTGLGLSISKGILEAHGGRLFLDQRSKRTKFVAELPAEVR